MKHRGAARRVTFCERISTRLGLKLGLGEVYICLINDTFSGGDLHIGERGHGE